MSRIKNVIEFLREARDRYTFAMSSDQKDRADAQEDVRFAAGDQWDPEAITSRKNAKRPILTWNRLPGFIQQVVNDGRQAKPAIKITVMDEGNEDTADFLQSRIRHIEYESNADIAYDTSTEHQVTSGRGFYKVSTRYLPNSFEQEIRIDRIEDQFSVLYDPGSSEYDREDSDYCFVISKVTKDEHARRFGKKTEAYTNWEGAAGMAPDWVGVGLTGEMIQIAEYWVKEYTPRTLVRMIDGSAQWKDELTDEQMATGVDRDEAGNPVERPEDDCTVCQYIIDGMQILDETEWLGKLIPVVPVWGKELMVNGIRRTFSLIRPAKHPQVLVNLYVSNIAEQIALMPKTPWVVAVGQIEGREREWEEANTSPRGVLQYHQVDSQGKPAPPPKREQAEPPIQALTVGLMQSLDAMKAACNIYDAGLGARSNETSGRAIDARRLESDVSNYHFPDNSARSRKYLGRIVLELIPHIDGGGPKTVGTRSEDGETERVRVGEPYQDKKTGKTIHHDLSKGNYGVAVSTGPTLTSQRQEAAEALTQVAKSDKNFMAIGGDILVRNMDLPGGASEELAERYKKMLPPQLQEQQGGAAALPPQVQQILAHDQEMITALTEQLHQVAQELEAQKYQTDARVEVVKIQEETKRAIALAELDQADSIEIMRAELSELHGRVDRQHELTMQSQGQQHELDSQQTGQEHDDEQLDASQTHEADQQAADREHQVAQQKSQQDAAAMTAKLATKASAGAKPAKKTAAKKK